MTEAIFGALVLLGCQCLALSLFVRYLNLDPDWLMRLLGVLMLSVAKQAGYECVVVGDGEDATTVRFDDFTRALNAGDVFTRVPDSSEGACDGRA